MFPKISTVINYCTNDYKFLKPCIQSVLPFSQEVIFSYCDCFFDGQEENIPLINKSIEENPEAQSIGFPYYKVRDLGEYGFMHNYNRAMGWQALSKPVDWILFIDCDEIADPCFYLWLKHATFNHESYRINSYWYFRETYWQAIQHEDSAVLTQNKDFTFDSIVKSSGERFGLMHTDRIHGQNDLLGSPMFHHYSWVGNEQRLLRKVKAWGHTSNRDWTSMIHEEFKRDFNETCKDPVHNYSYRKVKPLDCC
jgi:hypothetical protein